MFKSMDIGIDLGTANILVYVKGKGVVLKEPSVVAIDKVRNKVLAVGDDAREMLGRAPGSIVAIRPLKEGVIANYTVTQKLLAYVIEKVAGKSLFFKPRVMTCVPIGITSVEKRAVMEATTQGGASKTYLIEEPLAAALGAGIDISVPRGNMVVDIGGGTTDIAVLSLGVIVVDSSIRIGGDHFDEAIVRHVKKVHNVLIGERTAEAIKLEIGSAGDTEGIENMEIRGRDLLTGLPKTIEITAEEISEALHDTVSAIVDSVKNTLEKTPPELAADIMDRGIVLTGGGGLLRNLDKVISEETKMPVWIAENPLDCVAIGTGKALDHIHEFRNRAKL